MKAIGTALNRTFAVERETKAYGDLVRDTAKLIGRSFPATKFYFGSAMRVRPIEKPPLDPICG